LAVPNLRKHNHQTTPTKTIQTQSVTIDKTKKGNEFVEAEAL